MYINKGRLLIIWKGNSLGDSQADWNEYWIVGHELDSIYRGVDLSMNFKILKKIDFSRFWQLDCAGYDLPSKFSAKN